MKTKDVNDKKTNLEFHLVIFFFEDYDDLLQFDALQTDLHLMSDIHISYI